MKHFERYQLGGFAINIDRLPDYTRYTILDEKGTPIRKQISAPTLGDCQQGAADSRRKNEVRGYTP